MHESLAELFEQLPTNLGGHMLLSLASLLVGLLISLPLGIVVSRRPRLGEWALGAAGVVQTIPSLALLALMVPLLGGQIGFVPAFVAMTLYGILPMLANTIIGIRGVDPTLTEAARGLGMSDGQVLTRVELPLASPVIISGIRTATVLVVGTATLATPVGETTLGNYIFQGLNTRDNLSTVFGCVFAALLAVVLDQLIRLLEQAARQRSRALAWTGGLGLLIVVSGSLYAPLVRLVRPPANPAVVGCADFTEQLILGEVLRGRLERAGFTVDLRKGMGESIEWMSLCSGKIDCYVDYSGNIWATIMKRKDAPASREQALTEIRQYLLDQHGVLCLGSLGFENAYALAVPRPTAEERKLTTIDDLRRCPADWKLGGDLQFFGRPEWSHVRDSYGLRFPRDQIKAMDPTLMYPAVASGEVQVICAYTSDGRITADDLVVLQDPRQAFPPYDAIVMVSPQAARRPGFLEALRPLVGRIDVDTMRTANGSVDVHKRRPRQVGRELSEKLEAGM
jgi:osmoprotectant transport system permease protein